MLVHSVYIQENGFELPSTKWWHFCTGPSIHVNKYECRYVQFLMVLTQCVIATPYGIMGLLPDTKNCGLRMRRECRERFPHLPTSKETAS